MKQTEVDSLVSIIDELQANYWKGLKKGKIIIVDTSYLLDEDFLPMFSPIVVPFQVMIELGKLRKKDAKKSRKCLHNPQRQKECVISTI